MSDEHKQQDNRIRLSADQVVPTGTKVLIPKGVAWKSTHPKKDAGVTMRDICIKVQTSSSKWSPDLTWAGTGGYWRWCPKVECFYFPPGGSNPPPSPKGSAAPAPPQS